MILFGLMIWFIKGFEGDSKSRSFKNISSKNSISEVSTQLPKRPLLQDSTQVYIMEHLGEKQSLSQLYSSFPKCVL